MHFLDLAEFVFVQIFRQQNGECCAQFKWDYSSCQRVSRFTACEVQVNEEVGKKQIQMVSSGAGSGRIYFYIEKCTGIAWNAHMDRNEPSLRLNQKWYWSRYDLALLKVNQKIDWIGWARARAQHIKLSFDRHARFYSNEPLPTAKIFHCGNLLGPDDGGIWHEWTNARRPVDYADEMCIRPLIRKYLLHLSCDANRMCTRFARVRRPGIEYIVGWRCKLTAVRLPIRCNRKFYWLFRTLFACLLTNCTCGINA